MKYRPTMKSLLSASGLVARSKTAAPESYLDQARRQISEMAAPEEEPSATPRNLAMGAAFAYPLAMAHVVNKPKAQPSIVPSVSSLEELNKHLQPGDVVMMGAPRPTGSNVGISLFTGETDFQHAGVYTHSADGKPFVSHLERTFDNKPMFREGGDIASVRVLRAKNPEHVERLRNHVVELGNTFNPSTGQRLDWSLGRGTKAVLSDQLVPEALQRRMGNPWGDFGEEVTKKVFSDPSLANLSSAEKLKRVEAICTSVVGTAVPEAFKHKNPYDVLPKDILGSDAFEHVVERKITDHELFQNMKNYFKEKRPELPEEALDALARGRFRREKVLKAVAGHGRLLTSLGLGATGAGLVAAGFHAPDSDLSAGEAAVGLGALGLGAAPLVAPKLLDQWALKTMASRQAAGSAVELGVPTLEQFKRIRELPKTNFGKALPHHAVNLADTLRNLKTPGKLLAAGGAGLLGYNLIKDKEKPESRPWF